MILGLDSVTGDLVRNVLDASLLRQKLISNNIANNNVTGFKPSDVAFESLLQAELSDGTALANDQKLENALNSTSPEIVTRETDPVTDTTEKALDIEMSELAKNTLRYEALIKGMEKLGSLTSMAINGGRGK